MNPDFKINQRGKSEYIGNAYEKPTYTVDCWGIYGTLIKNEFSIIFKSENSPYGYGSLSQYIDYDYTGSIITLSAKINGEIKYLSGLFGSTVIHADDYSIRSLALSSGKSTVDIIVYENKQIEIEWIKLELGSAATPFVTPNPVEELLKCGVPADNEYGYMPTGIGSNPNLIVNPDFRINQRNKSVYKSDAFQLNCVDRWQLSAYSTYDVNTKTISWNENGALEGYMQQYISDVSSLLGKHVSISAKCSSGTGIRIGLYLYDGTAWTPYLSSSVNNEIAYRTVYIPENISEILFRIIKLESSGTFTIEWAKMEYGMLPTNFTHPDPMIELIKCGIPDDTIGTSYQPTLNISNPNLLDNPDFKINQRGQTEYNNGRNYAVDRWIGDTSSKIEVLDNGRVRITVTELTGTNWWALRQILENLPTGNHTLSINVTDISGDGWYITASNVHASEHLKNGINCVIVPSWSDAVVGIAFDTSAAVGDYIEIEWMKLEKGLVATPFTPPDPATELVKCQRYYEIITIPAATPIIGVKENHLVLPTITYSVPKRIDTPAIMADEIYPVRFSDNSGIFGAWVKKAFTGFYCTSSAMTGYITDEQENKIDAGQIGYIADPINIIIDAEL